MGMELLTLRLKDENVQAHLNGVLPRDSVKNARFAINFFTSIGLGKITVNLREWLKNAPKLLMEQKLKEYEELQKLSSGSDSDSNSDSDSDSSDSGSSSSGSSSGSSKSRSSKNSKKSDRSKKSSGKNSKKSESSDSGSRRSSISSES
eukprot:CAMPEP_0205807790 /NCGR_PEP_ID=MMETSP0205-20121125/11561_1 /ASSEMBLY_ACC=CAM_ASM_000278 /TAXON_ID=36767 /ORGANISM="Euplotes focardii, Strain TN1" /LENGTH=147 /DNA_ID=CAMNT_0053082455 /DNA_START=412 /DNA_END=852 /DNA_ORIENTATION=+